MSEGAKIDFVEMINSNFENGDLYATLSYSDSKESTYEEVEADAMDYLSRLDEWVKEKGKDEIKYVLTIHYTPDEIPYIHIFTNFPDRKTLEELWRTKGRQQVRKLRARTDGKFSDISRYVLLNHPVIVLLSPR